ncbi:MAG TPA: hypothetical protein VLB50_07650 [Ignavibacteriaceae bacterium]|nr:hypothetical protein [Ignavibacteriaceae bacterium]
MEIKSKLLFILKFFFSVYLGAVIGYIIMSLGSTKSDYFLRALSPVVLYNEIIAENPVVIVFAVLGIIFFILFK